MLTRDTFDVVADPEIDLVVEVIGGIEPARELITTALAAGKPVVTANKELLANVGVELFQAADRHGVDLLFEAAVAGGIPIVRALRESLRGEPIRRVMGIVNGTTNYILTKMTEQGAAYGEALAEAQDLGYAERDPTADVEGFDAGAKAAIIATIAFGAKVVAGDVYHEGISKVTAADIDVAHRLGYVVKLLAIAELDEPTGEIAVRVHPALVPVHHPLASVRESFNAVFVEGDAVGQLMFYGRGAGGLPTASAVLGDVIDAAVNLAKGTHGTIGVVRQGPHPGDRRDVRPVPPRPRGRRRAGRAARRHRCVRRQRREHPGRRAGGHRAPTPASCSSPTRPRSPPSRPPCAGCATSTSCGASAACCASSAADRAYVSTRGRAPSSGSPTPCSPGWPPTAVCTCRPTWPELPTPAELDAATSYADAAARSSRRSSATTSRPTTCARMCDEAYGTFRHPAVVPLVQIDHQPVGRRAVPRSDAGVQGRRPAARRPAVRPRARRSAASGSRSSARRAATPGRRRSTACTGCAHVDIVILIPQGGASEVQRRQMTTVDAPNVHAVAVEGTFDDCQDLVKAMFNDAPFRERMGCRP